MLSPTFLPPRIGISLYQTPSLLSIRPPKHTKHSNSKPNYLKTSSNFRCFSCETSSSASDFQNSNSHENPEAEFSGTQSLSQSLRPYLLALWLRSCRGLKEVRRLHAIVLRCLANPVTYVFNNLMCAYLVFGKLGDARKVFDEMTVRNVVSWTAIINGYLNFGFDDEALGLFGEAINDGVVPNGKMFVCLLNLCSERGDYELGKQIHAGVLKGGWSNLIVDSAVVKLYAQCGELVSAFCAFDQMPKWDVVCWTTMITACSQQGHGQEAFSLFSQMLSDGFSPNEFTVCGVLKACGEEKELGFGRQLHGAIVKKIYKNDIFIDTSLVDMYAKCGEMVHSRNVFDGMRNRNTVTWTSIIAGYARKGLSEEAIYLFQVMKRRNILVNNLTIVSILRACGGIRNSMMGREVHAQIVKNSVERLKTNLHLGSTLVWFYCRCGEYSNATRVLQQMPLRDVVSWTAIISGCTQLGHEAEALEFLKEMMEDGVEPNEFTYSSALKACAKLETVLHGKLIHSSANKSPAMSNVFVGSALIYMYAKCGYVTEAFEVFDSMPERNLVSWKAMIVGYATNGLCQEAMKLMYRMRAEGFEVDDYILSTVLTACGDLGWEIDPSLECSLRSS
ncbi:pentatricopeptide repeat-containing protein [Pyrus ussuriensis x Pyrus communis]|uniref:Pentatricopeptide repeat-containing protein n=1 Tax=Pyrus ussuriensis x Pyrus communis TaxID=2448454 RepID=A0A5N5GL06_9ROSA|nr:pentatricopeptide repeat-containing protein [Pyrus ussuriensis x Pyrus communis]KAB2617215.1 pentatricopeptide repeat-containing protein [Pyrus ussuriensis x Pyrus communis]